MKSRSILLGILLVYCVIALYRIDQVPGAWYGDISIEHEYVSEILAGHVPRYFDQSAGPFYHYIVALFSYFWGQSYLVYKIASVVIGLIGLIGMYLLTREVAGYTIALFTILSATASFWYLVWSRLGSSPQMISPALTAFIIYFALRKKFFLSSVIASLGLLTYPALFVLPLVPFLFLRKKYFFRDGLSGLFGLVPGLIGFIHIVMTQRALFLSGYIGSKVFTGGFSPHNLFKALGMWFVYGDPVFRVNIPGRPALDVITMIMVLLGIFICIKYYPKIFIRIFVAFFVLIAPSLSPGIPQGEIPNSGRTLGIAPIVFLFAGMGLAAIAKKATIVAAIFLLGLSLVTNLQAYFGPYQEGLPNHNGSWERVITTYINTLPKETDIVLTGCCWGAHGEPEPKAILYTLVSQEGREHIVDNAFAKDPSQHIITKPTVFIFAPYDWETIERFVAYYKKHTMTHVDRYGIPVFISLLSQ